MMSSRGLVRSMMIIGSTQVVNILLSILRMKVLAVLLGPAGVGLLSLYQNLQQMVSSAAGLGIGNSGVRQLASSKGDESELSRVRRVLLAANLLQGLLAMAAVWLLREPLALWLLDDAARAEDVGLIGLGILLTLLSASQTALLRGLRQIGDLGRVTVLGALAGTLVGLAAVWLQGMDGLIWFLIAQPLTAVLVALHYTRRLPKPISAALPPQGIWRVWQPMVRLGMAFMAGGLVNAASLLLVRSQITHELGIEAAGIFAAAWAISMTYVGFLLNAMGTDYYPRLAEVFSDRPAAIRLMNDQIQLGLAIGGPLLFLMIGFAPWAIELLYSSEFRTAATLVQWQTVGTFFQLAGWPLGFAHAASGRGAAFFFMQVHFNVIFLGVLWLGFPYLGLEIAGLAFLIARVLQFNTGHYLVRRMYGFRWQRLSLGLLALHLSLAGGLLALSLTAPLAGAGAAALLALASGLLGLRLVLGKIGPGGRVVTPLTRAYAAIGWPVKEQTP